jgi:hypothetical protein
MNEDKKKKKLQNELLMEELGIDKDQLNSLAKKLSKVAPRSERGTETLPQRIITRSM